MKHIALLALAASLLLGCSGDDSGGPNPPPPPPPDAASVSMIVGTPPKFLPSLVTVAAGGTVTFTNNSPGDHNVVSSTNVWPQTLVSPDETFALTLAQPGSYPYTCTIHPGMNGTITVK